MWDKATWWDRSERRHVFNQETVAIVHIKVRYPPSYDQSPLFCRLTPLSSASVLVVLLTKHVPISCTPLRISPVSHTWNINNNKITALDNGRIVQIATDCSAKTYHLHRLKWCSLGKQTVFCSKIYRLRYNFQFLDP